METQEELISAKSEVEKDAIYRHAYIYIASLFLLIALGFLPLKFAPPGFARFSLIQHIHGFFAMTWMCLIVIQTWLIGHDNVQWHRRLGKLSFFLAPMLVITAFAIVYALMTFHSVKFPLKPGDSRLPLAYNDLGLLVYFVLFYILAIVYHHDFRRHQRFMVCTALIAIPVSFGRILMRYVFPHINAAMSCVYSDIFIETILVLLILSDWRKQKIYFAYWFSVVFFFIQIATTQLFLTWRPWLEFWRWLAE